MENETNIREKVLNVLCEVNEEIRDNQDKDLLAFRIITSFDIVSMMMELEDAFSIKIGAEYVTPNNFRTVDSIVKMIEHIIK